MSLGRRPIENFFKRSAYKTEFDLFKKNSQLDLISLLSFDDNDDGASLKTAKNSQSKSRPVHEKACTARATTTRRSTFNNNRDFVRSRAWIEYKLQGKETPSRRGNTESNRRACKSAFGSTTSSKTSEVYRGARLRSKSTYCRRSNVERNDEILKVINRSPSLKQTDIKGEPKQTVNEQRGTNAADAVLNNNSGKKKRINTAVSVRTARSDHSPGHFQAANAKVDGRKSSLKTPGKYTNTTQSCFRRDSGSCTSQSCRPKSSISSRAGPGDYEIEDVCTSVASELGSLQRADDHENSDSEPSWISGDYKGVRSPDDFVTDTADAAVSDENDNLASRDSGFCSKTTSPDTKHHRIAIDEESAQYIQSHERRCVKFDIDNFGVSSDEDTSDNDGVDEPDADVSSRRTVGDNYAEFIRDLSDLENGANIFDHKLANSEADDHESGGIESQFGDDPCHSDTCREEDDCESASVLDVQTSGDVPTSGITDRKMSNEARHAIFETLQDMRLTGKRDRKNSAGANMSLHQGVSAKRRHDNNRQQYKYYLRERTNTMIRNNSMDVDDSQDTDNRRNEDAHTASTNIEFRNREDFNCDQGRGHGPMLPSIGGLGKLAGKSDSASSQSNVYTLDHVKKRKYKIPGIGNYNLVTSPDQEFEITPAGFDSRYNLGPAISEVEREPPPKFIQDQSINKCKKWLKNVSLAPLALKPAKTSKVSTRK